VNAKYRPVFFSFLMRLTVLLAVVDQIPETQRLEEHGEALRIIDSGFGNIYQLYEVSEVQLQASCNGDKRFQIDDRQRL
jgi:hypothetical protein